MPTMISPLSLVLLLSSLLIFATSSNITLNPSTTAFLHLDLLTLLIETYAVPYPSGQAFIASEILLLNALHALSPPPLNIFTRLYFSSPSGSPELSPTSPFFPIVFPLLPLLETSPGTDIYSGFPISPNDTTLVKTRYYAGSGNALEIILNTQGITTVVLSGVRTSGVVLSTAMRLFDGDYEVLVVKDCTLETPVGEQGSVIQEAILGEGGVVEKMGGRVVSLEDLLGGLGGVGE